jgi:hypothetical protein
LFQELVKRVRGFTLLPRGIALIPAPGRRHSISGTTRRTPLGRTPIWPLLLGFVLLAAVPAWAGQPTLPAGVPNIYDPEVRVHFQSAGVANLGDNPDFPVVLLVDTSGGQPQTLLLGLDARNGKDTWSLTTDPIILIAVFSDATTIQGFYVDTGFADVGKASGNYARVDEENLPALPDLLKAVTAAETQTDI